MGNVIEKQQRRPVQLVQGGGGVGIPGFYHQVHRCIHRPGVGLESDAKQVPQGFLVPIQHLTLRLA